MNHVSLIGRLTADPQLKTTNSGKSITSFTLAVNRQFNKDESDFIRCIAFGKTAEIISKYLEKGTQVAIEGRIQTGSYEKNGQKVYTTDIIVDRMHFIGNKSQSNDKATSDQEQYQADMFLNDDDFHILQDDGDVPF